MIPAPAQNIDDLDFGAPQVLADPWSALRLLQDQDPVFWSRTQHAWIITRHADVTACFRDERLSASRIVPFLETIPGGLGEDFPLIRRFENAWISNVDLPVHGRLRRLMGKAFSRSVVERLRPVTRTLSRDVLAQAAGRDIDFVAEIGKVLPSSVIAKMFGIPEAWRERFALWAANIQQATGAAVLTREMVEIYHDTLIAMNAALLELIEERRHSPKDDLLNEFVQARDAGDKLSDDELLGACHATIIAGFETTMHMMTLGVIELAERPQLRNYLLSGPDEAQQTVDELLRYLGMAKGMLRIACCDFEWHGKAIRKGDFVYGMNISANRDPRVWDCPDEILPQRDNACSMAFGPGLHSCLGHLLARMELAEFFSETFTAYDVRLLSDERPYINSFTFRGLERLPVRLTARPERSHNA
jgi:cytochrome P450